jgi:hypothetical protein
MFIPVWFASLYIVARQIALWRQRLGRERVNAWARTNGYTIEDIETRPLKWLIMGDSLRSNEHYVTIKNRTGRVQHAYIRYFLWHAEPDIEWDD